MDEFDNISSVHYQWPELLGYCVCVCVRDEQMWTSWQLITSMQKQCVLQWDLLCRMRNTQRAKDRANFGMRQTLKGCKGSLFGFTLGYLLANINKLSEGVYILHHIVLWWYVFLFNLIVKRFAFDSQHFPQRKWVMAYFWADPNRWTEAFDFIVVFPLQCSKSAFIFNRLAIED